jgi:NTP pyrophosphatase (non-canonical NTP hydrolase)
VAPDVPQCGISRIRQDRQASYRLPRLQREVNVGRRARRDDDPDPAEVLVAAFWSSHMMLAWERVGGGRKGDEVRIDSACPRRQESNMGWRTLQERTRMTIAEFQRLIERIYLDKDRRRGVAGTFMWFAEESGELARALRSGNKHQLRAEFADVLAWLSTMASIAGIDLEDAARSKYESGCPKCRGIPCHCEDAGSAGGLPCRPNASEP